MKSVLLGTYMSLSCLLTACAPGRFVVPEDTIRSCAEAFVRQNGLADVQADPAAPLFLPYPMPQLILAGDPDPLSAAELRHRMNTIQSKACGIKADPSGDGSGWIVGFLAANEKLMAEKDAMRFGTKGFFVEVAPSTVNGACGAMQLAHLEWRVSSKPLDRCFDNCKCR